MALDNNNLVPWLVIWLSTSVVCGVLWCVVAFCIARRSAVHKALYQGSLAVAALLLAAGGSLEVTDNQVCVCVS